MASNKPFHKELDDNAAIYQKRAKQSEREKWSSLDTRGKIEYFKTYYLKTVLALLVITGFIIHLIVTIVTPKPDVVLSVAMVNYSLPENELTQMTTDIKQRLNVDPKHEKLQIDTSFATEDIDFTSAQRLMLFINTGEIDILIAPQSCFQHYAALGLVSPLTDLLPTDLYSSINADDLFSCQLLQEDKKGNMYPEGPEGVYGINISTNPMFERYNPAAIQKDPPIIGVIISGENQKNAVSYIQYILNMQ